MTVVLKQRCRVCNQPMIDVLDLGEFVPSDFVASDDHGDLLRVPLLLVQCVSCRLVQLRHTLARDEMYRMYWYQSGLNSTMVDALRDVVRNVEARVKLIVGDNVVDIGANDGTLLSLYSPKVLKIGFDPARNLAAQAQERCDLFVNDYFESSNVVAAAKVITSIAMFYDLDDPRKFVAKVSDVLVEDGLWVMQMTDLVRMLRANAFDNVCHEHLCYYSIAQVQALVDEYGLEIVDVEFNAVNGASVRMYIAHKGQREVTPAVTEALRDEAAYLEDRGIERFVERVHAAKHAVRRFITEQRAKGKRFHALGASTKGNTLLQYFGLGPSEIECAAEVNADKFGLKTAGTNIPIVSEAESLQRSPDYYLVLPWHFIDFFTRVHADYLAQGGRFLTPLPQPKLYSGSDAVDL